MNSTYRGAHEVYVAISPLEAYETQSPTTPSMADPSLSQGESERSERSDTEDLTDERFKVAQEPSSRNRSQEDASEEGCAARILTAPVASDIRDQFVHKYNWEALEE